MYEDHPTKVLDYVIMIATGAMVLALIISLVAALASV
jgi:hypothetical protein